MVALREAVGLSDVVFLLDGPLTPSVDYPARYVIGSEVINIVGGKSTAAISVVRGIESTTIASHAKGAILTFAPDTGLDPTGVAISALPAVVTPAGTDEFPVNQAGQTMKMTLAQITSAIYPPSQKSFARTLLDLKPDRYWMLGEPSGTVCRDQTKANDGTYTGPPTLGQPGLLLGGDSGTAALFTAASSHKVDLTGNGINLTTGSPAFTFLAMLNPSSVTGNRFIFGAEAGGYEMDMVGAKLNLRCTGVSDAGVSKSNITINTTHLVGGDYTPGGIQAIHYWLDGVDDTDPARTTWAGGAPGFTPGAKVTWLGVDPTVGAYWSGLKQHCAIWKRALTAGEWATLWAATGR